MKRLPGFYWVKWSKQTSWTIADMSVTRKRGEYWWPFNGPHAFDYLPSVPEVIGDRIQEPKQ